MALVWGLAPVPRPPGVIFGLYPRVRRAAARLQIGAYGARGGKPWPRHDYITTATSSMRPHHRMRSAIAPSNFFSRPS